MPKIYFSRFHQHLISNIGSIYLLNSNVDFVKIATIFQWLLLLVLFYWERGVAPNKSGKNLCLRDMSQLFLTTYMDRIVTRLQGPKVRVAFR